MLEKIKSLFKKKSDMPQKYVSCEYIQHGFNVDYEDIKMCCFNCHEGGGRQILIDNYKGQMIDWNKFFKEKRKMRELNKPIFITNPSRNAERIFKMSGLYEIMPKIV